MEHHIDTHSEDASSDSGAGSFIGNSDGSSTISDGSLDNSSDGSPDISDDEDTYGPDRTPSPGEALHEIFGRTRSPHTSPTRLSCLGCSVGGAM